MPSGRGDDVSTETTYRGPVAFGEDLMTFEIGETVSVGRLQTFLAVHR